MSFGEQLRRYRERVGLTQEELAERAGLTAKAISALERGERRSPYPQTVRALADALSLGTSERQALLQARVQSRASFTRAPSAEASTSDAIPFDRLPIYLTPLIGRARELAELLHLLDSPDRRLVSVVGLGGIGKTRLAVEVARQRSLAERVVFVPLAPVGEPSGVAAAIADAIGLNFAGGDDLAAQLLAHLRPLRVLLMLDNLEHLLDPAGSTVDLLRSILAQAPGVRLLVTSRERLKLQAEWALEIEGLATPPDGQSYALDNYPAPQLFLERAQRMRPSAVDDRAVAQICRQLGGIPLGLELAAAWAISLSYAEIAAEIQRGLDFLEQSDRDTPARHRSMRVVFEHSWRLLSEGERGLLARLSIFRGGFTREAATFVAHMALPQLAGLAQKSLVRLSGGQRYDMHEVVRRFAWEKLAGMPNQATTRQRFLDYYLALSAEASASFAEHGDRRGFDALSAENDNLRAALRQAISLAQGEPGARLSTALRVYWALQTLFREGIAWSEQLLALPGLSDAARGDLLNTISYLSRPIGALARARSASEAALAAHRRSNDTEGLSWAYGSLAQLLVATGEYEQARRYHREAVALRRMVSGPHTLAWGLIMLMVTELLLRDRLAAEPLHHEAVALARSIGDRFTEGGACNYYALGLTLLGEPAGAEAARRALALLSAPEYPWGCIIALDVLAAQAGMRERHQEAGRLAGAARELRRRHQVTATAIYQGDYNRLLVLARGLLDGSDWERELRAGASLTYAELLALAETLA